MSLLIRFYDPQEGSITIDGVDMRRLSLHVLRAQLGVVLQEPLLFSGTIAENIRYGRLDATDDEVVSAAHAANAHEFISRLPAGYETELGERGAHLSGGERQRICIARAFVKDAPILILDEPTSSIDSKTENVILDALDELMVGRTSFMIAHRLSTVRDADLIIVLNHGRIVEQGTHDELLAHDGLYRQLHEAQQRRRRSLRVAARGGERMNEPEPQDRPARDDDQDPGGRGRLADAPLPRRLPAARLRRRTTSRRMRGRRGCSMRTEQDDSSALAAGFIDDTSSARSDLDGPLGVPRAPRRRPRLRDERASSSGGSTPRPS